MLSGKKNKDYQRTRVHMPKFSETSNTSDETIRKSSTLKPLDTKPLEKKKSQKFTNLKDLADFYKGKGKEEDSKKEEAKKKEDSNFPDTEHADDNLDCLRKKISHLQIQVDSQMNTIKNLKTKVNHLEKNHKKDFNNLSERLGHLEEPNKKKKTSPNENHSSAQKREQNNSESD